MTHPEETPNEKRKDQPSLNDAVYVGVGMPEMAAARIMRGGVVQEMLAALMREGIMTKEALSRALAEGQEQVEKICNDLKNDKDPSVLADEVCEKMLETAAGISRMYQEKFIDNSRS